MKKLLLLCGVLFLCVSSYCFTLSGGITLARELLKDTASDTTLQRYSDDFLTLHFLMAQRELIADTWCLDTTTTTVLSAGTTYYTMPELFLATKTVRFKDAAGRTRKLSQVSYKSLQENNPDFERQTGPPMQYFIRGSTVITVSSLNTSFEQMGFVPVPTASSTGTVTIDYYKQATNVGLNDALLDGNDVLVPYHSLIVYKVVSRIKGLEGDTAAAAYYMQLYTSGVNTMNSRLGEIPDYNPGLSGGSSSNGGTPR